MSGLKLHWRNLLLYLLLFVIITQQIKRINGQLQISCPTNCTCIRWNATCVNTGYRYIPAFPSNTRILTFNGNSISIISAKMLANLTNINITDLSLINNSIKFVHSDSFTQLRFLKKLYLQYNKLTNIPRFCGHSKITNTLPSLVSISLEHNLITSINDGIFDGRCLPNLSTVILSFNLINQIPNNVFAALPSLNNLLLRDVSLYYPERAKYPLFAPFAFNNTNLRHLDISNKIHHFSKRHNVSILFSLCPYLTRLEMDDIHLNSIEGVLLKQLLKPLKQLQNGSFQRTSITILPDGLFSFMPSLQKLDFTGCKISGWHEDTFSNTTHITVLSFRNNLIPIVNQSSFPQELLESINHLDLSNNPFECTCNFIWFVNWMKLNKNKKNFGMFPNSYICSTPLDWKGKDLNTFDLSYRDCHPISPYIIMAISLGSGLCVICLLIIVVYRHRWDIKYHIYMMRARRRGYETIENQSEFIYDAFVAYSHEERQWVLSQLLPNIEDKNHFKLCLHERDFQIGKFIIDNICDEINRSRKTLIVLSNNFTESQWCQLELTLAQKRHVEEGSTHLIVVLIDTIETKNMSNSVRVLLNTTTFIEWTTESTGNELFWGRLISALRS